jgi:hypothetical protein
MSGDELSRACDEAGELRGWSWVAGVLEGAVRHGWDAQQTAAVLRNP